MTWQRLPKRRRHGKQTEDVLSLLELARQSLDGHNPNLAEAHYAYKQAARLGSIEAKYCLALLHRSGMGVPRNPALFQSLIADADRTAQPVEDLYLPKDDLRMLRASVRNALGVTLLEGCGTERNVPAAAQIFRDADNEGISKAAQNLALSVLSCVTETSKLLTALRMTIEAAEGDLFDTENLPPSATSRRRRGDDDRTRSSLGEALSGYDCSQALAYCTGVMQDIGNMALESLHEYHRLEADDSATKSVRSYNLGVAFETGTGCRKGPRLGLAERYYKESRTLYAGNSRSVLALAKVMLRKSLNRRSTNSVRGKTQADGLRLLRAAAQGGEGEAEAIFAAMYREGAFGMVPNHGQEGKHWRRARDLGWRSDTSRMSLATLLERAPTYEPFLVDLQLVGYPESSCYDGSQDEWSEKQGRGGYRWNGGVSDAESFDIHEHLGPDDGSEDHMLSDEEDDLGDDIGVFARGDSILTPRPFIDEEHDSDFAPSEGTFGLPTKELEMPRGTRDMSPIVPDYEHYVQMRAKQREDQSTTDGSPEVHQEVKYWTSLSTPTSLRIARSLELHQEALAAFVEGPKREEWVLKLAESYMLYPVEHVRSEPELQESVSQAIEEHYAESKDNIHAMYVILTRYLMYEADTPDRSLHQGGELPRCVARAASHLQRVANGTPLNTRRGSFNSREESRYTSDESIPMWLLLLLRARLRFKVTHYVNQCRADLLEAGELCPPDQQYQVTETLLRVFCAVAERRQAEEGMDLLSTYLDQVPPEDMRLFSAYRPTFDRLLHGPKSRRLDAISDAWARKRDMRPPNLPLSETPTWQVLPSDYHILTQ